MSRLAWPTRRRGASYWPIREYVGRAPATMVYLFTLAVTSWTLRGVDPRLTRRLIDSASINVHNMTNDPLQVLVASAFWIDGAALAPLAVLVAFVIMVPAERWLGTRRWILGFTAGHVAASVVTVIAIAYAIDHGMLARQVGRSADVGLSYGLVALAALLTYRFTHRWRWCWAAALALGLGTGAVLGQSFTDYGHLIAAAVGWSLFPLARRANQQDRGSADPRSRNDHPAAGTIRSKHDAPTSRNEDRQAIDTDHTDHISGRPAEA